MRSKLIATITAAGNTAVMAGSGADVGPAMEGDETVIMFVPNGVTGAVTLQDDIDGTGNLSTVVDTDGNNVVSGGVASIHTCKLSSIANLSSTVSAGSVKVYALNY